MVSTKLLAWLWRYGTASFCAPVSALRRGGIDFLGVFNRVTAQGVTQRGGRGSATRAGGKTSLTEWILCFRGTGQNIRSVRGDGNSRLVMFGEGMDGDYGPGRRAPCPRVTAVLRGWPRAASVVFTSIK